MLVIHITIPFSVPLPIHTEQYAEVVDYPDARIAELQEVRMHSLVSFQRNTGVHRISS